jgi:hypothetical protein
MQIKRVSEPFMRRLRSVAAERGETVRHFVLDAVAEKMRRLGYDVPEADDDEG